MKNRSSKEGGCAYKKKSGPLTFICEEDRLSVCLSVLTTVEAIERFVLCSEISIGIIQTIALNHAFVEMIEQHRYLRTSRKGKVSEATVIDYLRKHLS